MELRDFINQLPEVSWARVAEVCTRSITPMYWVIHNTLRDDIEHLARVMAELDYPSEKDAPAKVSIFFTWTSITAFLTPAL